LAAFVVTNAPLLEVSDVTKLFPLVAGLPFRRPKVLRAVDSVSFSVPASQTVSIVGESGSGKTTLAKLILRIERPTSGRILYEGLDVHRLGRQALRRYRMAVQSVFQDPWGSLNPRMRVRDIIAEPLQVLESKRPSKALIAELLTQVGLESDAADSYPHEFSGGQRQRISIARAIAPRPRLIVLDEPVSSLDVSIGAQLTNLLKDIQERLGVAYLLIAHSLATVRQLSHHVVVLYCGQVVERASTEELFRNPLHPYTTTLLKASLPFAEPDQPAGQLLAGNSAAPLGPATDCRFRSRCPFAFDRCEKEAPALREVLPGHLVACHLR